MTWLIYKKAIELRITIGRSLESLIGAAIYQASKMSGLGYTITSITNELSLKKKELYSAYKLIHSEIIPELKKKYPKYNWSNTIIRPEQLVPKYISELGLSHKVEKKSQELLQQIGNKPQSKDPKAIAAAAIYIASIICNEKKSQKKVSKVTNITGVTLRKICREYLDIKS